MEMADLMKCTCKHEFQDEVYGKGMRVITRDKDKNPRCTVCGPKPSWEQRLDAHAKQFVQKGMNA
jgi:hypothetical protein